MTVFFTCPDAATASFRRIGIPYLVDEIMLDITDRGMRITEKKIPDRTHMKPPGHRALRFLNKYGRLREIALKCFYLRITGANLAFFSKHFILPS